MTTRAKTIIHINKHVIAKNRKTGMRLPPITVRAGKRRKVGMAKTVYIDGPCKIVYQPDNPLPCGAVVWFECEKVPIILDGELCESMPGVQS